MRWGGACCEEPLDEIFWPRDVPLKFLHCTKTATDPTSPPGPSEDLNSVPSQTLRCCCCGKIPHRSNYLVIYRITSQMHSAVRPPPPKTAPRTADWPARGPDTVKVHPSHPACIFTVVLWNLVPAKLDIFHVKRDPKGDADDASDRRTGQEDEPDEESVFPERWWVGEGGDTAGRVLSGAHRTRRLGGREEGEKQG